MPTVTLLRPAMAEPEIAVTSRVTSRAEEAIPVPERGISWGNWLEERDEAPLDAFSTWLRAQTSRTSTEQRAPNLNRRPDRLEELSREVFNTQRRHAEAYTVDQADLLDCVGAMAAMQRISKSSTSYASHPAPAQEPGSDAAGLKDATAAKARCQEKLRVEFGPPELPLPFEVYGCYLDQFIAEFAKDEQGKEVLLQYLIVQAHLNREAREAEIAANAAANPLAEALLDLDAEGELAMALGNGEGETAVGIATPQGRCRRPRKKGGYKAMFGAVCGP